MDPNQPRSLDLQMFQSIANTVTMVMAELKRIKDSDELKDILQKGQDVFETIKDAAQDAASDVNDMIVLALQIYDKSLLRSRNLIEVKDIAAITNRAELIDQVLVRVQNPEPVLFAA